MSETKEHMYQEQREKALIEDVTYCALQREKHEKIVLGYQMVILAICLTSLGFLLYGG